MTTYDMTQWRDFTRGVAGSGGAEPMRAHLANASRREQGVVRRFERVVAVARKDAALAIPEHALRVAKAAGSLRRPASARLVRTPVTVLFDSFLQAVPAMGTRALQPSHQQIVYQAEGYTVEVRLEQETNPHRQVVVGQILCHQGEARPVSQIPVLVYLPMSRRAFSNAFTESMISPRWHPDQASVSR